MKLRVLLGSLFFSTGCFRYSFGCVIVFTWVFAIDYLRSL